MPHLRGDATFLTIEEMADLFMDDVHHIQQVIMDGKVPYLVTPEGIEMPLGGFQVVSGELYDLDPDFPSWI